MIWRRFATERALNYPTKSAVVISVDSDPRRENPPLQTPEPISGWRRHTSVTPVTPANT